MVLQTFTVVLVATVLVTLFQPSVYQASAVVSLPSASDLVAASKPLTDSNVIAEAAATPHLARPATKVAAHVVALGEMPSGRFALVVESENPKYAAAFANAWAKVVTADSTGSRKLLIHASSPLHPIRPQKARNIFLGGLLGLLLGFALAFFRESVGPHRVI